MGIVATNTTTQSVAEAEQDSGLPKREAQRRRRARQKERRDALPKLSEDDAAGETSGQAALHETEEDDARGQNDSALREWSRLSVQMMLQMGWRAEEGPRQKAACSVASQTD